jgi:hypothetical protein
MENEVDYRLVFGRRDILLALDPLLRWTVGRGNDVWRMAPRYNLRVCGRIADRQWA